MNVRLVWKWKRKKLGKNTRANPICQGKNGDIRSYTEGKKEGEKCTPKYEAEKKIIIKKNVYIGERTRGKKKKFK